MSQKPPTPRKISELLPNAPSALASEKITLLTQDSRQAGPGALFFAIEGTSHDGHDFINDVLLRSGATAAVAARGNRVTLELERNPKISAKLIQVDDTRVALGGAASRFHGDPSRGMLICGVTGTNGKTTSTYLLESLLREWGRKPAVIGTVENRFGEHRIASTHTTPGAIGLQAMLAEFKGWGADSVAIEVSSHALEQRRTAGMEFAAALFTNLTQDHLDYHHDMDNYFNAKLRLFIDFPVKARAVNADDPWGAKLVERCKERGFEVVTFGRKGCNVSYERLRISASGIEGELSVSLKRANLSIPIHSPLLGAFNAQNLAGAAAVGIGLGIPANVIGQALSHARRVPGRMETVPNSRGVTVVVDYAHSPDALENVLKTLRGLYPTRLFCVFGCGGDRDPGKRPQMGALAEQLADRIFVTSDNPRTENPDLIIDAIFAGMKNPHAAKRIPDRAEAISSAISELKPGDILLIAGKGHEDYQIIGTEKLPFDDRKLAAENLR